MARKKKVHQGDVVSDKCFRLLRLKHEVQTDVKVLKAVVDEVDVLRLCRSLGMTLADEGNTRSKHEFEFGMFNSCDYDADFARFIREKFAGGDACSAQQGDARECEDMLEIGCLFGKQQEVKAELARRGCWSGECQERFSLEDQGVYCIECGDGDADRRQFVVFAWLDESLFEPEAVRDTPAYVLRFLVSLSSNITCCLSQEDFRHIKNEVDAASDSSNVQWKSCSVAFRVQKQVEQDDSISCDELSRVLIPKSKPFKSVWFVGGAFAAVAVESKAPSKTEWVDRSDLIPYAALAEWLLKKRKTFAVHLPRNQILPLQHLRDDLLSKFGSFPEEELNNLRRKVDVQQEEAAARIGRDVSERATKVYEEAVRDAQWLFAVRCPENDPQMDSAQRHYAGLVQQWENSEEFKPFDYEAYKMMYLPERIQVHMKVLDKALQRHQFAFEEVLKGVIAGDPAITEEASRRWFGGVLHDAARQAWNWLVGSDPQYSSNFRPAMEGHQPRLVRIWSEAVKTIVERMQSATYDQRLQRSTQDRENQHRVNAEAVLQAAFGRLCNDLESGEGRLRIEISRMALTSDGTAVNVSWSEQREKEPSKVIRMFQLQGRGTPPSLLGRMEFEPGLEIRKLETVKMGQVVAILGKENSTVVRRIQFPPQPKSAKAEQLEVRTFPHACSLCSIRASDRRVAFLFGVDEGKLGSVALCRFNESFTGVEVTSNLEMDTYSGLASPLVDILLTERSLCAVDINGDMQAFDVRTRRTSKKVSCKGDGHSESQWVGGLLSFADELVVGRVSFDGSKRLSIKSISNEDHRAMPTATLDLPTDSQQLDVGCLDDVLYVVDSVKGSIYSSELSVTVRSDAYRIQRSRNGAKGSRAGRLLTDPKDNGDAAGHWLRVFFHMFEKFPVRSLVDMTMNPDVPFSLQLEVVVAGDVNSEEDVAGTEATALCMEYFDAVMADLRRLNKPLSGLNLTKTLTCRSSEQVHDGLGLQSKSIRRVLMAIISFVPVQICRAEDNMLKLLQDGEDLGKTSKASDGTSSSDESDAKSTDASQIAQSIRFGLLSPLLETWNGRCVVVTSMGKQSTGKSYFLNHLAGTSFAISGSRCTDGAWMSLRFVSADVLLVVLDFEGLGSFERSEQEDIFLSVLNASVSMFTVFRMECRFDKDIDSLFARFQKGVQLIKNDPRLFRGLLYMSVKDVNMNDRQGVVDELVAKLDVIFESNRDQNFLTEMYAGQLEINCSPPFGTLDYFHCMENDAAKTLCNVLSPRKGASSGFVTGKSFLDCLRIVLAKISILDWTSMDKSSQNLAIADVKQKLPGVLRTGCHVSQSLVKDASIPSHLKENVLRVGSHEKIVVLLDEMREENASLASKWTALNAVVPLDNVKDEEIDFGFDVTTLAGTDVGVVEKVIGALFKKFLTLQGKQYGLSRLMAEDQSNLDAFLAFILRRRRAKVTRWLRGTLGDQLSEVRSQLEQRYAAPLLVYLSRCQHRCTRCQLGCMLSVMHASEVEHTCTTDHVCRGVCEYPECLDGEVPPCSRGAGHEGKCECEKGVHTCGKSCELADAPNCDKTCSKRAEHCGEHRCSVQVHVCGAKCSAATCLASCLLDIQREHSVHKCAEVQCLHPCLMAGCSNVCGEKDHFHGQAVESRVFAEESGILEHGEDLVDNEDATHLCSSGHACREVCAVDGICEQKVHLKKSARTYTGARGSFEYIYQEMNGCKKTCAHVLPSGAQKHDGLEHSCLAREEDEGQTTVHYCDVRCPSCSYYCNKHFGHMGLHATSHGNMRQTYFMAKDTDVDVDDRKYQVGERGIAEMCNLFCTKMGRGHVHFLPCERKDGEKCVYLSDASTDHRRHCTEKLFPPPGKAMDELLHAQFWTTIGWEDPCSDEERAVFTKCRYRCNAPEHEEDEEPSHCVLDAWHAPELKPDGADDGFAYVDGHKFECVHAVNTGKFHSIFVLDNSGSMSGQPWQDLLCACNEFGISRLKDGGENDVVSYVTFDHESRIFCEGSPLPDALQLSVPFSGGGTSFGKGLRAANEVLSRSDFEEYKAVLIFFSDGLPCDIEQGLALARHIRSSYAKYDLKAFAVGFGYVNLSVLERVATELGGEYRQVLDANALRTEFQRIAAVLSKGEASLALLDSSADSP